MILLDTHTLVWWLLKSPSLSKKALAIIDQEIGKNKILVSSISIWEISLLVQKKRFPLTTPLEEWLQKLQVFPELQFIPIDNTIAYQSTMLPGSFHSDPADRFIVATARILGAQLITKDAKIRKYKHVQTIW